MSKQRREMMAVCDIERMKGAYIQGQRVVIVTPWAHVEIPGHNIGVYKAFRKAVRVINAGLPVNATPQRKGGEMMSELKRPKCEETRWLPLEPSRFPAVDPRHLVRHLRDHYAYEDALKAYCGKLEARCAELEKERDEDHNKLEAQRRSLKAVYGPIEKELEAERKAHAKTKAENVKLREALGMMIEEHVQPCDCPLCVSATQALADKTSGEE